MQTKFIFMIIGVFFILAASYLLVVYGARVEGLEEGEELLSIFPFLFIGMLVLVFGIISLSACFYLLGKGKPRPLSDMLVNHIYEVIGKVPVDEGKTIAVLKEQGGKIRLFLLKDIPEAKFIKTTELETGEKVFRPFPPSEEASSSEEDS